MAQMRLVIIGGGLAGAEAAWQAARRGVDVDLLEMRPRKTTPAHGTGLLAELVCSNSLKSDRENSAPWLLKQEMRRTGSFLLEIARRCAVPAGQALAVDRELFAGLATEAIAAEPRIHLRHTEVSEIPGQGTVIVATGPLTSDSLAASIQRLTDCARLFFYDAISPIVDSETIDRSIVFAASRYNKSIPSQTPAYPASSGPVSTADEAGDYLNCPMNEAEYQQFHEALMAAESVQRHEFEDCRYFEACLPLEELARRGRDTLRFGPMKPVGLTDPRTGRRPYAVVQLRQENQRADSFNLVGFQNHLKFGEQKRILRMIPGLGEAEFLRYGQIHRNTYINAPTLLSGTLQLHSDPRIFFAGQICGVEGYVESIATGMLAGIHAATLLQTGQPALAPPRESALGSLCHYITHADAKNYQPANIAFDLLPPLHTTTPRRPDRMQRRARQCQIALEQHEQWLEACNAMPPVESAS